MNIFYLFIYILSFVINLIIIQSTSSPFKDVDLDYKMQDSNASEIATDLSKHAAESSSSEVGVKFILISF